MPNLRDIEDRRRLMLSRRRRLKEGQENAQTDQLLEANQELPIAGGSKRLRHRPVSIHDGITSQGRRPIRTVAPETN